MRLVYRNPLSEMIHAVKYPAQGFFIETDCGVKLTKNDPVYDDPNAEINCGACRYAGQQRAA